MSVEIKLMNSDGERASLALELLDGRSDVWVDADRDATVVQVGKVQMTVSRTGIRVVSREGPATGHVRCHEVELWCGAIPGGEQ